MLTVCLFRQKEVDLEGDFEPSLLNSAIYLIQLSMQVSTFAINYQGHPFRERIQDNKALYYGLMSVGGVALAGATELWPEVNEQLQLVKFPGSVSDTCLTDGAPLLILVFE